MTAKISETEMTSDQARRAARAAEGGDGMHANADVRRLLDAGYSITFALPPAVYAAGDDPVYMASVTGPFGSHWLGAGETPAAALRSVWPLVGGPAGGGCGHCDGMGCTRPDCATCATWRTGQDGSTACGVCGSADPDADPEGYCLACGENVAWFIGHDGPQHFRGPHKLVTGSERRELFTPDDGHAPRVTWRQPTETQDQDGEL